MERSQCRLPSLWYIFCNIHGSTLVRFIYTQGKVGPIYAKRKFTRVALQRNSTNCIPTSRCDFWLNFDLRILGRHIQVDWYIYIYVLIARQRKAWSWRLLWILPSKNLDNTRPSRRPFGGLKLVQVYFETPMIQTDPTIIYQPIKIEAPEQVKSGLWKRGGLQDLSKLLRGEVVKGVYKPLLKSKL